MNPGDFEGDITLVERRPVLVEISNSATEGIELAPGINVTVQRLRSANMIAVSFGPGDNDVREINPNNLLGTHLVVTKDGRTYDIKAMVYSNFVAFFVETGYAESKIFNRGEIVVPPIDLSTAA